MDLQLLAQEGIVIHGIEDHVFDNLQLQEHLHPESKQIYINHGPDEIADFDDLEDVDFAAPFTYLPSRVGTKSAKSTTSAALATTHPTTPAQDSHEQLDGTLDHVFVHRLPSLRRSGKRTSLAKHERNGDMFAYQDRGLQTASLESMPRFHSPFGEPNPVPSRNERVKIDREQLSSMTAPSFQATAPARSVSSSRQTIHSSRSALSSMEDPAFPTNRDRDSVSTHLRTPFRSEVRSDTAQDLDGEVFPNPPLQVTSTAPAQHARPASQNRPRLEHQIPMIFTHLLSSSSSIERSPVPVLDHTGLDNIRGLLYASKAYYRQFSKVLFRESILDLSNLGIVDAIRTLRLSCKTHPFLQAMISFSEVESKRVDEPEEFVALHVKLWRTLCMGRINDEYSEESITIDFRDMRGEKCEVAITEGIPAHLATGLDAIVSSTVGDKQRDFNIWTYEDEQRAWHLTVLGNLNTRHILLLGNIAYLNDLWTTFQDMLHHRLVDIRQRMLSSVRNAETTLKLLESVEEINHVKAEQHAENSALRLEEAEIMRHYEVRDPEDASSDLEDGCSGSDSNSKDEREEACAEPETSEEAEAWIREELEAQRDVMEMCGVPESEMEVGLEVEEQRLRDMLRRPVARAAVEFAPAQKERVQKEKSEQQDLAEEGSNSEGLKDVRMKDGVVPPTLGQLKRKRESREEESVQEMVTKEDDEEMLENVPRMLQQVEKDGGSVSSGSL